MNRMILDAELPKGVIFRERILCGPGAHPAIKEAAKHFILSCHPDTWAAQKDELKTEFDVQIHEPIRLTPTPPALEQERDALTSANPAPDTP